MNRPNEIEPPWIKFPDYTPGHPFWRQDGEPWFIYIWEPYYRQLDQKEQEKYRNFWKVPKDWLDFYFEAELEWIEDPSAIRGCQQIPTD